MVVWGNRVKGHLFQGNRRTISATFVGNRQTKKILWEHGTPGKQFSIFVGTGEQATLFHGTMYPPPCKGIDGQCIIRPRYIHKHYSYF